MASTELVFSNDADARAAIADVRNNGTPANWVLFSYSDAQKNTLDLVGKGNGGVEELKTNLSASKVSYGLVRVTDQIDNSVTVKFVFIVFCGEKVPFVKKAQVTTHKGSISLLIGQYHNDINASEPSDLSEEIVMQKVSAASGTASFVKDNVNSSSSSSTSLSAQASAPSSSSPAQGHNQTTQAGSAFRGVSASSPTPKAAAGGKQPGVPQQATVVNFTENEEAIRNAIKAVRANNDPTDWMLLGYESNNSNKIKLVGTGAGGMDELTPLLKEDQVNYGLYRTTDTIDNTVAVKFVLIIWIGERVAVIRKAKIATHKGEVTAFVGQYHVDVNCSNNSEISEEIVRDAVQRASGTAIHVK